MNHTNLNLYTMKDQKRNNAIIYTRVSKPTLDRKRIIDAQKAACEKFANENGIKVLEYFEDADGINREGLFKMLEYIRVNKGIIEFVLVLEKNSISSDTDYLEYIEDSLSNDGIRIISVNSMDFQSSGFNSVVEEVYQSLYSKVSIVYKS
jgi:DNA invertase Pin-like site-specific DNA recombinase